MTLIFETHATSLDNEAGLASGWLDVDLSGTGEEQARVLGARHRNEALAIVFCSDLKRSYRTAEIAFGHRSVPIVRDGRLRECDYGDLTRAPAPEIDRQRPLRVVDPFPNGESYDQVVDRVAQWLRDVPRQVADGTVLLVGHRATFYALEHLLNGVPLQDAVISPWAWRPGWRYRL